MKISITTSELNEMINLVLKPERMDSMFDLRKNIQTYANLEMIQLTVLNSCGKGFIECLDEQVDKMQNFSTYEREDILEKGVKVDREDFSEEMKRIARLSVLYIFHNYNKNNNKYNLIGGLI